MPLLLKSQASIFTATVALTGFLAFRSYSQCVITGKVYDEEIGNVIPLCNIYLASTEASAVSAIDGSFKLSTSLTGKYDLIFSYTGFVKIKIPILIGGDTTYFFDIGMTKQVTQLDPVFVTKNHRPEAANLRRFTRNFLGQTANSEWCTIVNPEVISLVKNDGKLVGFSHEPILVINEALGYKIFYDLEHFEATDKDVTFTGISRFEELVAKDQKQKTRWISAREHAYSGSLTHFMRSLLSNKLQSEGWEVRLGYTSPREPDAVAKAKMLNFRRLHMDDSAAYYQRMLFMPPDAGKWSGLIDGKELLSLSDPHKIDYRGTILICYKNENDDRFSPRRVARFQYSKLTLSGSFIKIYDNGYFEPQKNIFRQDYMAWSANVAEFIPFDYTPFQN
jgi:hypothetical protein